MTLYAIGDIHGHLTKLRAAHARIDADRAAHGTGSAPLIHIGDLVDRGPDSAGVIAYLMRLRASDPRIVTLTGNHDAMLTRWLETGPGPDPRDPPHVRYLSDKAGGGATLASYDVDPTGPPDEVHEEAVARIPRAHREFLAGLPRWHRAGECLFVHAGIRPGIPFEDQDPEELIWIRDGFLDDPHDHGPLVVHGHTPVEDVTHAGNRLAIDTGAAYGGPLSAVAIEGRDVFLLTEDGRLPVPRPR
ncbi:serine/threonine protein phosphatase [Roseibacterium beibuensis]|uniref:Metallophosphoesterase family protein n=1 Tax=[Roseibacterium] beibuensis TaxID=1193142 RepID=A0ABP9LKF6_9RHOB|nr:metallophosphoesterase family protein [Roseibacterium beibuensis]MCS6625938.1 serine/threonine protein phosphatase [Roseibacterium beibuensis]